MVKCHKLMNGHQEYSQNYGKFIILDKNKIKNIGLFVMDRLILYG